MTTQDSYPTSPLVVVDLVKEARKRQSRPKWHSQCIKGDTGKPLPILANALIGLRAGIPYAFAHR